VRVISPGQPPEPTDDDVFQARVTALADLARTAILPAPDPARTPSLARTVDERLVKRPPTGSHWATSSGCGTKVEPTPEEIEAERLAELEARKKGIFRLKHFSVIGCGMGHTPEKSRRFLYFFARAET
jgi:hypothetical protein